MRKTRDQMDTELRGYALDDRYLMTGPAWDYARAHDVSDWKDNEFGYCCGLVMVAGNESVPRESVSSYLAVQRTSALKDGRPDVAAKLEKLAADWEVNRPE